MPTKYVVPQFLDVESKIIGPITVRQFLILMGVAGLLFLTWRLATLPLFIFLGLIEFGVGMVFAFFKINGQPFHLALLNFLQTSKRPSIRVWGKEYSKKELKVFMSKKIEEAPPPPKKRVRPSESRLAQLSLVVNTGGAYTGDEEVLQPLPTIEEEPKEKTGAFK